MERSHEKIQCFACEKESRPFLCGGCSKQFCRNDFTKHFQLLDEHLEQTAFEHNAILHRFIQKQNNLNRNPLLEDINQWEKQSIEIIQQLAEQYRTRLLNYTKDSMNQRIHQLNTLAKELQNLRQENNFNEIDLEQCQDKLQKLEKQLDIPNIISINKYFISPTHQISLLDLEDNHTKWKRNGIVVCGETGQGCQLNQLDTPIGICIDENDQTLYICDCKNHRIIEWKKGALNGRIIAGGNGQGDQLNQLNEPAAIVVDHEMNMLIIADTGNRRVIECSRQNQNMNVHVRISNIDCCRLTLDKDGSLYVSDYIKHEIKKWKRGDNEDQGIVVAGGNGQGENLNQLYLPSYIFVDDDYTVYVSDTANYRVMKWIKNAREGIIVAGGNGKGDSFNSLDCPCGLFVDRLGRIYVSDFQNNRVMRWREGDEEGSLVVGDNNEESELKNTEGLTFDREGNLYVVDSLNHRIMKFELDFD